jgi:hypothetical protein
VSAARAAQSGDARGETKTRDGNVEAMRVLRVARSSARKVRTQALNQMRSNEGLTKNEAFRCRKRYIAREVYNHLPRPHLTLDSP